MTSGPSDEDAQEDAHEVEREAVFFAVLRERARPVDAAQVIEAREATALPSATDVARRLAEADEQITAWLDEAEEEGDRIIEQARAEASRLRMEAHEQAERLRQAAERAASEAGRERERVVREAEAEAAAAEAEARARTADVLREAEEAAVRRRREAADEATALLEETREAAERRLQSAERDAEWVRTQAAGDARALHSHAVATVQALQADIGTLHEQLAGLVAQASSLLPALEAAHRSLAAGPPVPDPSVTSGSEELAAPPSAELGPGEPHAHVEHVEHVEHGGLGALVVPPEPVGEEQSEEPAPPGSSDESWPSPLPFLRRRPLGRLLRRR